jgi:hypothetical protein
MSTNYEQQKQNEGKIREIAIGVAALLPGKWAIEAKERDYSHYCEIEDAATGAHLGFSTSDGKVHVSGQFVTGIKGDMVFYRNSASPNASIGVGITRTFEVMAREIERRLFPSFLPEWQRNLEAIAYYHKRTAVTLANATNLATFIGAEIPPVEENKADIRPYHSRDLSAMSFDITVQDSTVRFDRLELPMLAALDVLAILKRYHAAGVAPAGLGVEEET